MWFCPTYQRPEGLQRLADSWVKYAKDTPLVVRIYEEDAKRKEYEGLNLPESWQIYVSNTKHFSEAMNEFFARNPDEETYGFVADDIELTSEGGLEHLEALATPFFIAYPNDTIQRERLPTHWCVGGDLVRALNWFAPPFLKHNYTDNVWKLLGQNCGLLRYAPNVVFYHHHFIKNRAELNGGYDVTYDENKHMVGPLVERDAKAFQQYLSGDAFKMDVALLHSTLLWVENSIRKEAGLDEEETVSGRPGEPLVSTGDVPRGVGRRDNSGKVQELQRPTGRVSGAGAGATAEGTSPSDNADSAQGGRLSEGGIPLPVEARIYKYPDANVTLAIPSTGDWCAGTGVSTALLINDFMQNGLPGLRSRIIHIHSAESSMLVRNRHSAVKTMLQSNSSHLLFIDSDMKFPPWALRKLMSYDLPIVAANCTKRGFPVHGTAHDFEGNIVESHNKSGLETVRQVGAAFMLIRRDVLEKLRPPLFMFEWVEDLKDYCGEDIYFSQLVQQAGFDMVIDHDLSKQIGHIGRLTFGHGQVGAEVPPSWEGRTSEDPTVVKAAAK